MFISFEGIDGSGKSTQIKLLQNKLENLGKTVVSLREPGGTELSEKIRELLLHKDYELNSESELLLFEAARAYLTNTVIIPSLRIGKIVLIDRFFDSTIAYQGYGRGLDLDFVEKCNQFATQNYTPDLTFYLKVDLNTSNERRELESNDRIENSGIDFYQKVKNGFDEIANKYPYRIVTINAEMSIENIHNKIFEIVIEKLNQSSL